MSNLKSVSIFFKVILFLAGVGMPLWVSGQQFIVQDSLGRPLNLTQDSIRQDSVRQDSMAQDTLKKEGEAGGITSVVLSNAEDSTRTDRKNNQLHLYGNAKIKYEDMELTADYIRIDNNTRTMFASGLVDHNGKYKGRPIFKTATDPPVTVDSLIFNFDSKKGKTYGVFTEMDGASIQAREIKKNEYNEQFIRHGFYSTCNLPFPHTHFGIQMSRVILTENQVVSKSAYMVVEQVPLRFVMIPFGFFPKTNKRQSGILFPTFGEDFSRGFFMRDGGYYIGINDYWDAELRGNLYSKGSWETSARVRYKKNYKYDGGFSLRYAYTKNGEENTPGFSRAKDFNITWNHSQRQEANPGTTFSASVNAGTGTYFSNTAAGGSYDYNQLTRNNMSSSIAYGKTFADGKVNFTSSLSHRQDISTGQVNLELPTFNLNVATFNPFDSKERVGEQKWYQRITMGYSMQGKNSINAVDSLLFTKETLQKMQNGIQHNIPVSMSLNVARYFQFNTNLNYTERWYFQSIRKFYDNTPVGYQEVIDTVQGFNRAYDYSFSSGFSTKVYGQKNFKGKLAAIRHVITPSVNFNYRPDFSEAKYGFYREERNTDGSQRLDNLGRVQKYSIFQNAIYGTPSAGQSMGIGFSVDNNIEAKVRSEDDTTGTGFKKVPILQGLTFSGNYNFVADSFKLSNISFSGRTALFDQKLGLNFNGSFDPYRYETYTNPGSTIPSYRRVNEFAIKGGQLARLTQFGLSMDFSFNPAAAKSRNNNLNELDKNKTNMTPEQQQELARISSDPNAFVDFNIPWNVAASFSFQYSKPFAESRITSTINLHGDFSITPKWKVQYNTGYDFQLKKISLTQFNIYRDLHCWDMSFGWVPFGTYRSYTFNIRVKASILQDLKLTKRNDYYNSF
ncbi:putative LPS assembly protein LptD [Olivibacter sp. XZL3]|uniref:putative LPS assembly protein LptD n=1 Tax=Olivibacter sp. XZL3 TaxID=1735116 RepID=UPI001F0F4526|nr:putative LPS assembly protein LptD [Olivibacter sp. XZL3]